MYPEEAFPSPDGRYKVNVYVTPMRMSHEVNTPYLMDLDKNEQLFDPGSMWDGANIVWREDSRQVSMVMRHYDNGTRSYQLTLEPDSDQATLLSGTETLYSGTLKKVQSDMENHRRP